MWSNTFDKVISEELELSALKQQAHKTFCINFKLLYLLQCSTAFTWHFNVLKTFRNSCKLNNRNVATFWDVEQIFTQAIWTVAFQKIVESVSFLTANINWWPLESKQVFELKEN